MAPVVVHAIDNSIGFDDEAAGLIVANPIVMIRLTITIRDEVTTIFFMTSPPFFTVLL